MKGVVVVVVEEEDEKEEEEEEAEKEEDATGDKRWVKGGREGGRGVKKRTFFWLAGLLF